jgi:RNA polymerase sigma-70 factor (sigma-E family)
MQRHDGADFEQFVAARQTHWMRTAFMLAGHWHAAEDLVQAVLERLYVAWPKVESPDAYVRRALVNAHLSERRRPWRRERAVPEVTADTVVPGESVDDRLLLIQALRSVSPRQRTTLVLRYWEDLSVAETAELMHCAPGTVKRQTADGLKALRAELNHTASEEYTP